VDDIGERTPLEGLGQGPRGAKHEWVMHPHGGNAFPDECRREASAQDVKIGPLRH
jgi:hypothetical protein